MSNCIRFTERTKTVVFPPEVIDGGKLMTLIKEHESHSNYDQIHGEDYSDLKGDCMMVYWFLNSKNVRFHHGSVTVAFADGRSTHSWRDFQGTIGVINRFLKKEQLHWFTIEDEGFPGWNTCRVLFQPGHDGSLLTDAQKEKISKDVAKAGPPKSVTTYSKEGIEVKVWNPDTVKYDIVSQTPVRIWKREAPGVSKVADGEQTSEPLQILQPKYW
jgi:hypothetical protein